ncbi:MAG: iron-regulated protein [Bacteroidetes bacterium RIFCSPLOWO2_12_FULL_35_15]|nr:MAG: iron-regulated protein [Bacteroidetes bacterium RIFCSPLOWO2_12_FULL_35_15]
MKLKNISIIILLVILLAFKEDKLAYQIYDIKGKESNYSKMLNDAKNADVILFGELHNNPICHWLQLELTKDLYDSKKEKLILSAEMFEADDQIALTEYLQGKLSDKTLKDEVKLWPNYTTDYKPLLSFAKTNHLNFIAANIPRRYANMVYSKGLERLDSIDTEAKKWICPLPMKYDANLKCYDDICEAAEGHNSENLPKSQAIKDATMAYFILKNWSKGKTVIHYNGTYHSNFHQGIEWYLKQTNPDLKVFTIGSTEQAGIDTLAKVSVNMADYIICTPESMTKTSQ